MKKIFIITFIMLLSAMIMVSGCAQTNQKNSNLSTTSSSFKTSSSEDYVSEIDEISDDPPKKEVEFGIYTYYLDMKTVLVNGEQSGFMLYRRTQNSDSDVSLNVLAYDIKIFGEGVYILVNNDDFLSLPEYNLNSLYRIESSGKLALICSGYDYNSIDDAILQFDNRLYYSKYNESAIYQSDLKGENLKRISISYSEDQVLADYSKLREPPALFTTISIDSVEKDAIFIKKAMVNENGAEYCLTYIKKSLNSSDEHRIFTKVNFKSSIMRDWIYYLGDEIPANSNSDSEIDENPMYELHRAKLDGSTDKNLHVPCFNFDFAGEYLYVDTNLFWGDFSYWKTSRYNLDGTGKKPLEYGSMNRYSEGDRLYFTTGYNDNNIYVADSACNELMKINIKLPDESEVKKKLFETNKMENFDFTFVEVVDQDKDWLYFEFRVTSTSPTPYFFLGYYRVNLNSLVVERVSTGDYFTFYPSE